MAKVRFNILLDVGDNCINFEEKDEREWLDNMLNDNTTLFLHSNELGDTLGDIEKVSAIEYVLPNKTYVVKMTETTKSFPKQSYYLYEIGEVLHETYDINQATFFQYEEAALSICEFINETYDYRAEVVVLV